MFVTYVVCLFACLTGTDIRVLHIQIMYLMIILTKIINYYSTYFIVYLPHPQQLKYMLRIFISLI